MRDELPEGYRITQVKHEQYFAMSNTHFHPYYEFYFLLSGSRKIFVDDSIYKLGRGDLLLIPKGAIHRTTYLSDESHERIVLKVTGQLLAPVFETAGSDWWENLLTYPLFTLPELKQEMVLSLLQRLEHEWESGDPLSHLAAEGLIRELVIQLLRFQRMRDLSQIQQLTTSDEMIQKAAKYMRRHYAQPVTLATAASVANMSPTYFSKKFKWATGFGFKEYLLKIRLQESAQLLLSSDASITEIAAQCGWSDSNYFAAVFKKEFGLPPLKFRKHAEEA